MKERENLNVDLVLNNAKAYVDKKIVDCSIAINEAKIFKIGKETTMPNAEKKIDLKNLLVLPGLIDVHVHLRDEGKSYKEDFYTGTAAAAAGGITTVLDMPNNKPITMSVETVKNRMKKAEKRVLVNVGFYSEFPEKIKEIKEITEQGAIGFKLFMAEQIGGLKINDDTALSEALKFLSKTRLPLAVHAEDNIMLNEAKNRLTLSNRNDIDAFLEAHSEEVEVKAVKHLLNIAKKTLTPVHFCHISTEKALKTVIQAKKSGSIITCEATPHHLLLSAEDLKKIGTLALTMPPLRNKKHLTALWDGIKKGAIDVLASDHAPHTFEEKTADSIWEVKVGIPGLETILPLLLTQIKNKQLSITDLIRLMAEKPAEIFKLDNKGYLNEGKDADLTVINLKQKYKIDSSKFLSKAQYSPFDGWRVEGKPVKTFVEGKLIMDDGEIVANAGSGRIIRSG
jgi:dihydroorotase (multifunctional complex type)